LTPAGHRLHSRLVARQPRALRSGPTALGFTLLELLVVVAIMAMATAGVSLSMRDSTQTQLEREAQRLVALLEAARAQSRASGVAVHWQADAQGFRFDGLNPQTLPRNWLSADTAVRGADHLLLGPEPIIERQSLVLYSVSQPTHALRLASDGLRPFAVQTEEAVGAMP
jgi:general secretion pathway protein H